MQKVVAACNRKVVVADMITRFIRDVTLHILCRKALIITCIFPLLRHVARYNEASNSVKRLFVDLSREFSRFSAPKILPTR